MRVTGHAATKRDLDVAASAVVNTRAVSVASGQILIDGAHPPSPYFTTQPFRGGSLRGDWVVTAGTANNGVVLYLHGRRFQYDEEPDILGGTAVRCDATAGTPAALSAGAPAPVPGRRRRHHLGISRVAGSRDPARAGGDRRPLRRRHPGALGVDHAAADRLGNACGRCCHLADHRLHVRRRFDGGQRRRGHHDARRSRAGSCGLPRRRRT